MYKEIVIGAGENPKTIGFLSNGVTPLTDSGDMEIAGDKIPELAYIMAKQAEKADMSKANYEGYIEWLSQFEALDIVLKAAEIANVYISDSLTSVEPKKNGKGKANA